MVNGKRKLRRLLASVLMIAMASTAFVGCGSSKGSSGKSGTIKVGVLFSESGSTALVEKTMTNACTMAFDEINANGGINGKKIEYIHEDYASDPATATEKIKKLMK